MGHFAWLAVGAGVLERQTCVGSKGVNTTAKTLWDPSLGSYGDEHRVLTHYVCIAMKPTGFYTGSQTVKQAASYIQ